jgi:hypothetical protein
MARESLHGTLARGGGFLSAAASEIDPLVRLRAAFDGGAAMATRNSADTV